MLLFIATFQEDRGSGAEVGTDGGKDRLNSGREEKKHRVLEEERRSDCERRESLNRSCGGREV